MLSTSKTIGWIEKTKGTILFVSGGFTVPYHYGGRLKLRKVYEDRKKVVQQQYHELNGWWGDTATCTIEKFGYWDFDEEIWWMELD